MVSLLALGWVLLTSHCRLEAVPGFAFLPCAAEAHESSEGADPCNDTGCCSIESAQYRAPRQLQIAPAILLPLVPANGFAPVQPPLPKGLTCGILTDPPPALPGPWQFSHRTALPARAPSPAS